MKQEIPQFRPIYNNEITPCSDDPPLQNSSTVESNDGSNPSIVADDDVIRHHLFDRL